MEEKSHITPNGWVDHQTSIDHKQKMKTNTDYTLSERGLPTHQTVSVRNDSGSDGYNPKFGS